MSDYKEASRLKLRFTTASGPLTVEQLWDLTITNLDTLAVKLQDEYKSSAKKSFIVKSTAKDKLAKLKFNLVLDILTTKVEEAEAAKDAGANKAFNARLDERIARKQDAKLDELSVDELEKMRK